MTKCGANRVLAIKIPSGNSRITCKAKQRHYLPCYITWQPEVSFPLLFIQFFFQNYRKLLVGKWYFALDFCDLNANYMILNAKVNEIYACKKEWEF